MYTVTLVHHQRVLHLIAFRGRLRIELVFRIRSTGRIWLQFMLEPPAVLIYRRTLRGGQTQHHSHRGLQCR